MAKKTILKEAVSVVRNVAGATLDAAAEEARRVIAETVAGTAARIEERAKDALPAAERGFKERLVKPVDRALGAKPAKRRKGAKKAAPRRTKKAARKPRPSAKTARRRARPSRAAARKKRR